jgi:hypothetical protein
MFWRVSVTLQVNSFSQKSPPIRQACRHRRAARQSKQRWWPTKVKIETWARWWPAAGVDRGEAGAGETHCARQARGAGREGSLCGRCSVLGPGAGEARDQTTIVKPTTASVLGRRRHPSLTSVPTSRSFPTPMPLSEKIVVGWKQWNQQRRPSAGAEEDGGNADAGNSGEMYGRGRMDHRRAGTGESHLCGRSHRRAEMGEAQHGSNWDSRWWR